MISFHMQYRQIYWRSEHFVRTAVEIIGLSHLFTFLHIQKSPLWITCLMPKVHQKSEWYVWYYWRSPLSCSFVVCVCGCLTKYLCEDLFFSGHHPNQTGFCCHHRSHFRSLGLSTFLILLSTFLQFFRRHPRATLFRSASAAWCIHTTCNKYSLVTSRDYLLSSR